MLFCYLSQCNYRAKYVLYIFKFILQSTECVYLILYMIYTIFSCVFVIKSGHVKIVITI